MLVLGALPLGAQQPSPFPHKTHLGLGLGCETCHKAAATSTKISDNLLPSASVCKPCHDTMTFRMTPRPTPLTQFSHAQHLKLGNVAPVIAAAIDKKTYLGNPDDIRAHLNSSNACLGCHRGIDTSVKVSDANMPQMADCLVCHNKIEPPFSCATCHDPKWTGLRPASHAMTEFMDQHSTKAIAKVGCAVCHGQKFTCMGCHSG